MERLDRLKRRQILKDDQNWIGKPFALENNARAIQANTRHLALMLLDTQAKRRASKAAMFAEQLIDKAMASKVTGPVACGKGCHFCCKTFVGATIPEVLRLAQAVRGKSSTRTRIDEAALVSSGIAQAERERTRVICPILDDKMCSEYAFRPVACRSVLSTSLDTCLRVFEQNTGEPFAFAVNTVDIRTYLAVMLQAALILGNLPHRHHELNQSLAIALRHEDAEERWLAGEPLFAAAPVDQDDLRPSALTDLVQRLVNVVKPTL